MIDGGMNEHKLELCARFHHAVEVIGRRWSGAIVMLLLQCKAARFNELLAAIPGISDRLLTERLRELEAEGIVRRTVEPGPPVRVTYGLSEAGKELEQALTALGRWAERWVQPDRVGAKSA
jgi:DNA-binding HxlR family transcriptional regulator